MDYLRTFLVSLLCATWLITGCCWAADRPYTDGTVWTVTFVRTKPGMNQAYLQDLANNWKRVMDEAKKEQLILSYKILGGTPGGRDDFDLMLLVESKNWASFDGADDKFDGVMEKLIGTQAKQTEMLVKRGDLREIMGTRNFQELMLK